MRHLSLALLLVACTGDDGNNNDDDDGLYDITDQPLQGVIGGEAWTFVGGETNDFLSDETDFFATLYDEAGEACGFGSPSTDFILSVPTELGTFPFSFGRNATFVVGDNENLVSLQGTVRVDSITADSLEGAVYAVFDDDNEIDGTFTLTLCAE